MKIAWRTARRTAKAELRAKGFRVVGGKPMFAARSGDGGAVVVYKPSPQGTLRPGSDAWVELLGDRVEHFLLTPKGTLRPVERSHVVARKVGKSKNKVKSKV